MRGAQGVHGANERQVVGMLGHIGEQLRDVHAALAVFFEPERRGHQPARISHNGHNRTNSSHRLALALEQLGLRIKGIHLTHAAVAED